jgi:hypothetical protein
MKASFTFLFQSIAYTPNQQNQGSGNKNHKVVTGMITWPQKTLYASNRLVS